MSEEVIKTTSGCDAMMGSLLGAMANKGNCNDPMAIADFNDVVDAVMQLNQVWKEYRDRLDNKTLPSDIYEKLCGIDESIGSLISLLEW